MIKLIDQKLEEFYRLLGKLVHLTAQFDFNVGLQLASLGSNGRSQQAAIDLETALHPTRTQLGTRLKQLRRLVFYVFEELNQPVPTEIATWFAKAEELRALRNDYVHGRWGYTGGSEFTLCFTPLNWEFSPEKMEDVAVKRMTLEEFSAEVEAAEILFAELSTLLSKHFRRHRSKSHPTEADSA